MPLQVSASGSDMNTLMHCRKELHNPVHCHLQHTWQQGAVMPLKVSASGSTTRVPHP